MHLSFSLLTIIFIQSSLTQDNNTNVPSTTTQESPSTTTASAVLPTKTCLPSETKFVYTPCDETGNHWRVQVPRKDCKINTLRPPKKGIPCSFTCAPGEFLNIDTQKCQKCLAGEYSVGDGKRFAEWDAWPDNFNTNGYHTDYKCGMIASKDDPCADAGWKLKGDYIASNGSHCRSLLKYEIDLARPGNITFKAKSGDESSFFHVWAKSASCNAETPSSSGSQDRYLAISRTWKEHTIPLGPGRNTIFFLAAYFSNFGVVSEWNRRGESKSKSNVYESDAEKSVMIGEIVVRGFAFSTSCEKCEEGTWSKSGSSSCSVCPKNKFSKAGSGYCTDCPEEQYSFPKASSCITRKPCAEKDYNEQYDKCTLGKTYKTYRWVRPQLCSSTNLKSVPLPPDGPVIDCPPCNPGFFNNGTSCLVCKRNTFSDGFKECKTCPPQHKTVPGLVYKIWNRLPKKEDAMHLYCIANPGKQEGCRTLKGWTVHEDHISTGIGHADDAELLMYVRIPGFTQAPSTFTMEFEITCQDECRMRFQEVDLGHNIHTIQTFEGKQIRQTYTYIRRSRQGMKYRIVFERKYDADEQTFKSTMSRLKIYNIEITNAENGGAKECVGCTEGSDCITCLPGQIIKDEKCVPCPKNTYLPSSSSEDLVKDKCLPCPNGMISDVGSTACHSDCLYTVDERIYDFTSLSGLHSVMAPQKFTSKGFPYYHTFKLALCGSNYTKSTCRDNATKTRDDHADSVAAYPEVHAAVCRVTLIPDGDSVLSAQSLTIGDDLSNITSIRKKISNHTDLIEASSSDNIVLTFNSNRITEVCKSGSSAQVHLVCDPKEKRNNAIQLGTTECLQETCDGCSYHFTWRTMHACPLCSEEDYEEISTGCEKGKKRVHYVWKEPHVCYGGVEKEKDVEMNCSILEKSILDFKLVIAGFLLGAVILAILVVFLCYRNRSLSYKYNRLIDVSMVKDGEEFPESEKCALEDGEEDDDFVLSRGNGGGKLLDRIKGLRKNKESKFSEFETINLDSMKNFSDDDDDEL